MIENYVVEAHGLKWIIVWKLDNESRNIQNVWYLKVIYEYKNVLASYEAVKMRWKGYFERQLLINKCEKKCSR